MKNSSTAVQTRMPVNLELALEEMPNKICGRQRQSG